jgi:hypothetical protein
MTALKHWDRQRGFVPPSSELPIGDLYICWSPAAIQLGLYFWDAIDEHYYANNNVPKIDRPLWTVDAQVAKTPLTSRGEAARGVKRGPSTGESQPNSALRTPHSALAAVRLGAGREPIPSDPELQVRNLSGTKNDVRNIAVITLPAARLGKEKLQAGDTIELDSTLTTHGRAYFVEWKGSFQLRN